MLTLYVLVALQPFLRGCFPTLKDNVKISYIFFCWSI